VRRLYESYSSGAGAERLASRPVTSGIRLRSAEESATSGSPTIASKLEKTGTPGIFRRHAASCERGRCSCPYVVVWRHRGRQHTDTFRTLAEAREAKGNRDAGDRRPVARVTFGDYFEEWIETYAGRTSRGFSETSRVDYRRAIGVKALPRWCGWKLAEVEPTDVRDLLGAGRKAGDSTVAIKKLRAALSALFATALEDGLVRSNPVRGVRVPAAAIGLEPNDDQAKALTRAELGVVLAAIPDGSRLFFELLVHTGLRISEAVGLTWAHLDLGDSPRVLVREQFYKGERKRLKSGNGRRDIPLSPGMAGRLLAYRRDTFRGEDAPVFSRKSGDELYPQNVSKAVLKPAAQAVGLGWVTFHTFRHTCASLLFDEGRNVKQVAEWLGHADPSFTLRTYVHLMDEGIGDADFFDRAVTARSSGVAGSTPASATTLARS
jgi:integrase